MTIIGSYKDDQAFDQTRIILMMRDTLDDSLESLQESVRQFTPVFAGWRRKGIKIGELKRSISIDNNGRVSKNVWEGEVYSDLEYAAAIEYGMSRQIIVPTHKKALRWYDNRSFRQDAGPTIRKSVDWPGYKGAHMFQLGREEFERTDAEDIAEKNTRIYLGARGAAQTVAF